MDIDWLKALSGVLAGGVFGYTLLRLHTYLDKRDPLGEPPAGHWAPSGETAVFVPDEEPIEVTIYSEDFINNPNEHEFGAFVKKALIESGVPLGPLSEHPDYAPLRGTLVWRYSHGLDVVTYRWTPQ